MLDEHARAARAKRKIEDRMHKQAAASTARSAQLDIFDLQKVPEINGDVELMQAPARAAEARDTKSRNASREPIEGRHSRGSAPTSQSESAKVPNIPTSEVVSGDEQKQRRISGASVADSMLARAARVTSVPRSQSRSQSRAASPAPGLDRSVAMREVFDLFDLDLSGKIEREELLQLGIARRALGQKNGEWTDEMNDRLIAKLGGGSDGKVACDMFVHYFVSALAKLDADEFAESIRQFKLAAESCTHRTRGITQHVVSGSDKPVCTLRASRESNKAKEQRQPKTPLKSDPADQALSPVIKTNPKRGRALWGVFHNLDRAGSGLIKCHTVMQLDTACRTLSRNTDAGPELIEKAGGVDGGQFVRHFTQMFANSKESEFELGLSLLQQSARARDSNEAKEQQRRPPTPPKSDLMERTLQRTSALGGVRPGDKRSLLGPSARKKPAESSAQRDRILARGGLLAQVSSIACDVCSMTPVCCSIDDEMRYTHTHKCGDCMHQM